MSSGILERFRKMKKKRRMKEFYSAFIKPGDICFDIGANHGNRTELFSELGAKVVAVEPQNKCITSLEKQFRGKDVEIINAAVSSHNGEAELFICNYDEVSTLSGDFIKYYSRYDYLEWNAKQKTKLVTLDSIVEKYGTPDFCKIDVEGHELEVFQGLSKPLKILSFEYTPPFRNNIIECVKIISSLGNAKFNYSVYETMQLELNNWQEASDITEEIKELPDTILHGDIYARFI